MVCKEFQLPRIFGTKYALNLLIVPLLMMNLVEILPGESMSSPQTGRNDPGFYGIVAMDPWYTWNTDTDQFPNDVNRIFLERMAADISNMGATWIRMEVHADRRGPGEGPGPIDWAKYDWFLNEVAPKYGLKVLVVAGSGIIGAGDPDWTFSHINEPMVDGGSNRYIGLYVERVREFTQRYSGKIHAVELLNEPNASVILSVATEGKQKAVVPANYGRLMRDSFDAIKSVNPQIQVVLGGVLYDTEDNTIQHGKVYTYDMEWLEAVYGSREVQSYRSEKGRLPFDALAVHPYFLDPTQILAYLDTVRELQNRFLDDTPIWITEVGIPAEPPADWDQYGMMAPSESEREQAAFMSAVYTSVRQRAPYVDRIFWFKYEDFPAAGGQYESYGLVRLHNTLSEYGRNPEPWPRKFAYTVYQALSQPTLLPMARVAPTNREGYWYFPETGHTISEPFLTYWLEHGAAELLGFPLTEPFRMGGRQVQYFERARLEFYPEHAGTDQEIQLGDLGRFVTRDRFWDRDFVDNSTPGNVYIVETGQNLNGPFLEFWNNRGGAAQFGLPISPQLEEDGKIVQYFEKTRMELNYSPNDPGYWVGLARLGAEVIATPGWYR